jgi:exonuclease SbcD
VQVTLTDARRPLRAMELLRRRFPHTLVLQFPTPTVDARTPPRPAPGTSDHAISLDFVRHVRGSDATPGEAALLHEAIDACCHDPDQDVLVGAPPSSAPRTAGAS